jgi:hypothetical protein
MGKDGKKVTSLELNGNMIYNIKLWHRNNKNNIQNMRKIPGVSIDIIWLTPVYLVYGQLFIFVRK